MAHCRGGSLDRFLDACDFVAGEIIHDDHIAAEPAFAVDRLVQDFTRGGLEETKWRRVLEEFLGWLVVDFVGNSQDLLTWPRLDPLAPHAMARI